MWNSDDICNLFGEKVNIYLYLTIETEIGDLFCRLFFKTLLWRHTLNVSLFLVWKETANLYCGTI